MKKSASTLQNNINANDEKCHKMSLSTLESGGHGQEISELVDTLRKIGYFQSFQVKEKHTFSEEKRQKRRLKPKKRAEYRKVNHYYKSRKQYLKERTRGKLCWLLSAKYTQSEIADMLSVSRRTVIRDLSKITPYYSRLSKAYFRRLNEERQREFEAKLEGMSLSQRFDFLLKEMLKQRRLWQLREYWRHYQIIHLDLTQTNKYGIPKMALHPKGNQTLAYPCKIRIHVRGVYEGRTFEADLGGFNITQKSVW